MSFVEVRAESRNPLFVPYDPGDTLCVVAAKAAGHYQITEHYNLILPGGQELDSSVRVDDLVKTLKPQYLVFKSGPTATERTLQDLVIQLAEIRKWVEWYANDNMHPWDRIDAQRDRSKQQQLLQSLRRRAQKNMGKPACEVLGPQLFGLQGGYSKKNLIAGHIWPQCTRGAGLSSFDLSVAELYVSQNALYIHASIEAGIDRRGAFLVCVPEDEARPSFPKLEKALRKHPLTPLHEKMEAAAAKARSPTAFDMFKEAKWDELGGSIKSIGEAWGALTADEQQIYVEQLQRYAQEHGVQTTPGKVSMPLVHSAQSPATPGSSKPWVYRLMIVDTQMLGNEIISGTGIVWRDLLWAPVHVPVDELRRRLVVYHALESLDKAVDRKWMDASDAAALAKLVTRSPPSPDAPAVPHARNPEFAAAPTAALTPVRDSRASSTPPVRPMDSLSKRLSWASSSEARPSSADSATSTVEDDLTVTSGVTARTARSKNVESFVVVRRFGKRGGKTIARPPSIALLLQAGGEALGISAIKARLPVSEAELSHMDFVADGDVVSLTTIEDENLFG